jgi:hypothetical protein
MQPKVARNCKPTERSVKGKSNVGAEDTVLRPVKH